MTRLSFLPLAFAFMPALTSCNFEIETEQLNLPCWDGWQYDALGQIAVNPETGAAIECGSTTAN